MLFINLLKKIDNRINNKRIKKLLNQNTLRIHSENVVIKSPQNIKIGKNCSINNGVFLHGGGPESGGIEIGNGVTISANTQLISYTLDTTDWKNNYLFREHVGKKIYIGDGTWIGAGAIILPGVQITGKGVLIAAGAIVTKNITEDFVVVAGNPARIIKRL